MKSLRYWLGLPTVTFIIWILLILVEVSRLVVGNSWEDSFDASIIHSHVADGVIVFIGIPLLTMATAFYYPVDRDDCLPIRKTILVSFAGIVVLFLTTFTILDLFDRSIASFDYIEELIYNAIVSVIISTIEMSGYSLGLFIVQKVSKKHQRDSSPDTPQLR
ncbi:MAG: hypothetical protein IKG85_00225 [Clostridia bacterium]|nr:hypothetical protein [Clostridia bacterium]